VLRRRPRHRHADPKSLILGRFALAALALAAGAAGCGDGGEEGSADLLVPSKAGYISQADGLCGFWQDRTERQGREAFELGSGDFKVLESGEVEFRPGKRPADPEITSFVAGTVVPNLRDQLEELRALTPPEDHAAPIALLYDQAQVGADGLAADPAAALDPARMKDLFGPPLESARAYGFRICGAPPPTVPAG
jgi:hypothetical protein